MGMTIAVKALIVSGAAASIWCAAYVGAEAAPCAAGLLTGAAALATAAGRRPARAVPPDPGRPTCRRRRQPPATSRRSCHAPQEDACPQVPPGFSVEQLLRHDAYAAPDPHRAQRRHLRRREPCRADPGPAAGGRLPARRHRRVRLRARPAVRDRLLSAWARPAIRLRGREPSRGSVSLQQRRSGGAPRRPRSWCRDLPQGAGNLPGRGHWTRDVVFSADGSTMFVSVGSYSNVPERAARTRPIAPRSWRSAPTAPAGASSPAACAIPVSLSISPVTGALWATINERDGLGDDLVPDFVTAVQPGQFFGWPWFYIGANSTHGMPTSLPRGLPPVSVPDVLLQAHSASLGSAFYTGAQFPAEYHGSLFVAAHGSWNRPTRPAQRSSASCSTPRATRSPTTRTS